MATVVIALCGLSFTVGAASRAILLATTTSVQDSGLLDVLIPAFEKESGYIVKTIVVGSGHAMVMGQKGEVDVLLVHSPEAQKKFVAEGSGRANRVVMHNDFVIVGPPSDPAKVRGSRNSPAAFRKIAASKALFLSRHDNSGTHVREMEIWKAADVVPGQQTWYQLTTGLGMGQTLFVADERRGYTLTDRATYLALKNKLELVILGAGDQRLVNLYYVIEVNAAKWPKVNAAGAKAFADFLVSPGAQKLIGEFGVARFGEPLFYPDRGKRPGEPGGEP
jgi:tungstate transport system substrate-binding protein